MDSTGIKLFGLSAGIVAGIIAALGVRVTPEQGADKMIRRVQAASEDVRRGVQSVTEAPSTKAIAKQDKMLANLTESILSGRWAAKLAGVSLSDWKTAMLEKGVPRIAPGVAAAKGKIVAFNAKFYPFLETVQSEIENMPDNTLEERIERSAAFQRRVHDFKEQNV